MSLLVNSVPGVCVCVIVNYPVYLSPVCWVPCCLIYLLFPVFLCVTLPCLTLMSSLKTIILKYILVCVFLVPPCCVHRDRRPDQTVSVVPSPRFVLFVFSSFLVVSILHISDLYTHNCLYYILCVCYFVHFLIVYLYIIILLSVSCPVAVILLQCGASVTITNSSYV